MKKIILILIFSITILLGNNIHLIEVDGIINPASSKFIISSIEKAEDEMAECLIIQLDTPGGLMTSMRDIIKAELNSKIPIIVYVAPSGSRAASAGVFITMASHVAAMAKSTNIGAAHPVNIGGGIFGNKAKSDSANVEMDKVINDAVAYIQSIAKDKNRNVEWARDAVTKSVSIPADEAVKLNVVDFIAPTLESLLDSLDNKEIILISKKTILQTKNKKIIYIKMNWKYRLLDILSNPNIAYIFLILGFYGLFFELSHPGVILPGVLGALFLILAFFALQVLPVNYAGIALIILGIILFILEIKIVSFGMLTIGGIISMIIGSVMLIDSFNPLMRISWSVIIPVVLFSAAFFLLLFKLAFKAYKNKQITGIDGLVGMEGNADTEINPEGGSVYVNGEIWRAYSDEKISKSSRIQVMELKNMKLKVKTIKGEKNG